VALYLEYREPLVRKRVIGIGLIVSLGIIGLGIFSFEYISFRGRCGEDSGAMVHWSMDWIEKNKLAQSEIEELGIGRSSDPWALFEAFSKRFSLTTTAEPRDDPRDIQSIAATGGGDRRELIFVLRHLLTWNDLPAEEVQIHGDQKTESAGRVGRWLVYVRSHDQYFDPMLPLSEQPSGSNQALFARKPRTHTIQPGATSGRDCLSDILFYRESMWPFRYTREWRVYSGPRIDSVIQFNSLKFPTHVGLEPPIDQTSTMTG
jgi:hypothetical protein